MLKNNSKISLIVKNSYEKLKRTNSKIKKYKLNLKIKGKSSYFDSVDVVTFFSLLDKEIEKNNLKNPDFMNEEFFFKFNNIDMKQIIKSIQKINGIR